MTVNTMLSKTVRLGGLIALAICVLGGGLGFLLAGLPGLLGALVGAVVAGVFLALTALSILLGFRASGGDMLNPVFFAIVIGGWVFKVIAFIVLVLALRSAPWMDPYAFFFAVIAAVIGSLVVDVYVFATSRVPYVSDISLPPSTPEADLPPTTR